MGKYIGKRLLFAVITLAVVITLTFFLMYLVPGGPFLAEKAPSPATLVALNEKYGLDRPVYEQFFRYVGKLMQGDFGLSMKQRGRTVNDIIFSKFPVSARLGGISVLVAFLIGVPLGSYAALHRGKFTDKFISVIATSGISIPSFIMGNVLVIIFAITLRVVSTFGLSRPIDYILPVISIAFYPTAYISRLMRSSMLDVLGQDYMRTARAKGLSSFKILFKHALRNAILPVVTYLGPLLAYTLTGSFIVERIFVIPGLGSQFIDSVTGRDYPLIMGTTIFLAALVILMNVVVDIVYKLVDPRIRLE